MACEHRSASVPLALFHNIACCRLVNSSSTGCHHGSNGTYWYQAGVQFVIDVVYELVLVRYCFVIHSVFEAVC